MASPTAHSAGVVYLLSLPVTDANIGAKNGAAVSVVEFGNGIIHQTVFTLTALPLTIDNDAGAGAQVGGVKVYDFPTGQITILNASGSVALTTTSVLEDTLNASSTYNWGVGTTIAANSTLATTEQNIIPTTNGTSSATINVAGATSSSASTVAPLTYNGKSTAIDAFFNVGVANDVDLDGDATVTVTGTITINWVFNGNV